MAPRSVSLGRLVFLAMLFTVCAAFEIDAQPELAVSTLSLPANADKWDAKTCLSAARAALARGDLDAAEALALQAENTPRGLIASLQSHWSDTPAKVFRDIEDARARQRARLIETIRARVASQDKKPPTAKAIGKETSVGATTLAFPPIVTVSDFSLAPPPPTSSHLPYSPKDRAVTDRRHDFIRAGASPRPLSNNDALDYLMDGLKAFMAGDTEVALARSLQAKDHRQDVTWSKESIDRLAAYIRVRANANVPSPEMTRPPPLAPPHVSDLPKAPTRSAPDTPRQREAPSNASNDEESEPIAPPTKRIQRGLRGEWLLLVGLAFALCLAVRLASRLSSNRVA